MESNVRKQWSRGTPYFVRHRKYQNGQRVQSRILCLVMFMALAVLWYSQRALHLLNQGNSRLALRMEYLDTKTSGNDQQEYVPQRFDIPDRRIPVLETRSLQESQNRLLYSSTSNIASDGLGHSVAVLNAEIYAALSMNLTYSHRTGEYGSLTDINIDAVETFFGWGRGEVPREEIQESFCDVSVRAPHGNKLRPCPVCQRLKPRQTQLQTDLQHPSLNGVYFREIVNVPIYLSHARGERPSNNATYKTFAKKHNRNNTLFQLATEICDQVPTLGDFHATWPWFYWKYWSFHGARKSQASTPDSTSFLPPLSSLREKSGRAVSFDPNRLIIAVHVRRGDVLGIPSRPLVSSRTFARLIRHIQRMARTCGGKISRLPTSVHIFSEGRLPNGTRNEVIQHDVRKMSREYIDERGVARNVQWWRDLLANVEEEDTIPGSNSIPSKTGKQTKIEKIPIPKVVLRVSEDTLSSLHDMASADVFIGSPSGLSNAIVGIIGRGVQLLPPGHALSKWNLYDPRSGRLYNTTRLENSICEYGNMYSQFMP